MKAFFIFCSFLFFIKPINAQLQFKLVYDGELVEINKEFQFQKEPIVFTKCKFYISNIQFYQKGELVQSFTDYRLMDMEDAASMLLDFDTKNIGFDKVIFSLGVDSAQSVSGVFGGDLDPTHGMYWAWQSGFINCKIEGTSPICPARKNKFQFHLGGYAYPYNSLQEIVVNPIQDTGSVNINIDLAQFISSVDLFNDYQIMSPSLQAVRLSKLLASTFKYHE